MSGPEIPEGAVKLHAIGEAYADQATIEEPLSRMALSPVLQPIISLPTKPPPARAGYMPGAIGGVVAAVALNFSSVGLFNRDDISRLIVKVHHILIHNGSAGNLDFTIRRDDQPVTAGMTFSAWVPSYADAGVTAGTAIGRNTDSTETTPPGAQIIVLSIPAGTNALIPFGAVINNGQILVTGNVVNQGVTASFYFDTFPISQTQRAG